jgi:outer membrane protein W
VDLGTNVHNYGITALYYLNDNESSAIRPFLSIGVGGNIYMLTRSAKSFISDPLRGNLADMNNSHELALNYGVGFKTRSSGWLGFRMDARGFLSRTPSFGLARRSDDPTATVFPVSGGLNNAEASVGLVFYFYGKR